MKKRAGIARALALDPPLLFLDEPSAGLDPVSSVELDQLILTLSQGLGLTVVIVTHELASIFKIARRCIVLDKKTRSIIARGDPRELRDGSADPDVRHFFNRPLSPQDVAVSLFEIREQDRPLLP
jgi:phospholipid/cholesterol/gamma-HCH transport system ATP-binding protein